MNRTAKANWSGNLKSGKGLLTTESTILENTHYSYKTRFENGEKGTNPEELLAAAHAGCFTMAVTAMLSEKGFTDITLDTEAIVSMEGLKITGVVLKITGTVAGLSKEDFVSITLEAEKNCLISKVLNIPISSSAEFFF
jgi:lipoyl-dependent peroxiredoxin